MAVKDGQLIDLETAKELVSLLENNEQNKADALFTSLAEPLKNELFAEVGKLTRQLHKSINNFQLDSQTTSLLQVELPNAKESLNYVIQITEDAANKTMDLVDEVQPLATDLKTKIDGLEPLWRKLMSREIDIEQFKHLCKELDLHISQVQKNVGRSCDLLSEIVLAQGFQDLSGQVLRRTIDLVHEVQDNLVGMLKIFGQISPEIDTGIEVEAVKKSQVTTTKAEGPIVNKEGRTDVVQSQDEVDDLLSSLGF
jgi:chemotaxis protein CheZ